MGLQEQLIGCLLLTELPAMSLPAELYEIFLSRAKEKWRSYSETSSINDSESGATLTLCTLLTVS